MTSAHQPPARRPAGREETIEAVVRVASRQLAEVGPVHMTVRGVAREAGVNHALVHRHLDTKENLIAAALQLLADDVIVEVAAAGGQAMDAFDTAGFPTVHRYVCALARCLLEPTVEVAQSRFPVLDQLMSDGRADGLGDETARTRAVAILSVVFGRELFGTHLAGAAHLATDQTDQPTAMLEKAVRLLDEDLRAAQGSHAIGPK